jgi:hypothetical protein
VPPRAGDPRAFGTNAGLRHSVQHRFNLENR